ncbi:Pre-mRNA-splicing factor cef1 [Ceratobasidium sp. 428]|nr:Pre-mRNA-splicing factor cef1 [Ceratobasidium sp. 428]
MKAALYFSASHLPPQWAIPAWTLADSPHNADWKSPRCHRLVRKEQMGTYLIFARPENAQRCNTEDEKFPRLAELVPPQWRTIAPIVGRTAAQCLERYQRFLNDVEAEENKELGLGGPEGGKADRSAGNIC